MLGFSWALLSRFEAEYGNSFYLLDIKAFERNYNEFLKAFRDIYRNTKIAYSYKTNYIPKLCKYVNLWGGYAEVVSNMEYDLAIRIGVPPHRIIFNGPYKSKSDITKALLLGSIVNLDSAYEVLFIEDITRRLPERTFHVGLRCNFNVGGKNLSRFGFDVEGDEFASIFRTLDSIDNCCIRGLHCHFLPRESSVKDYASIARKMLEISNFYFRDSYPQFIDLGGGFFSKMNPDLRNQFPFPIPTYQQYAEAIAHQFASAFPNGSGPELILEPGMAITADIMKFVAKVIDIKKVQTRKIALLSGSVYNIKPTKHEKNMPVQIFSDHPNTNSKRAEGIIDLVGYTCMEDDCLYQGYEGSIGMGDYVVFDNVGAYTIVLKPPFILPCPPVLAYDPGSKTVSVIKRKEEFSDVFSTFTFK